MFKILIRSTRGVPSSQIPSPGWDFYREGNQVFETTDRQVAIDTYTRLLKVNAKSSLKLITDHDLEVGVIVPDTGTKTWIDLDKGGVK